VNLQFFTNRIDRCPAKKMTGFSNYIGPLAKCNQQKVQGVLLTYKSAQKFIGNDAVELLVLMPGGFAWENHFDISVR
jgi:hypothetical protein